MKLGRTAIATLTAASVSLVIGLGMALPANAAAVPAAARSTKHVVLNCNGKPEVRPGTIVLACADYGLGVEHLHWTRWTSHGAAGRGRFWEHLCVPDCIDGHIEHMAARITLRGSAAVKGHPGDRQYTRLIAVFPHKRPTVYKRRHGKIVATHPKRWVLHI